MIMTKGVALPEGSIAEVQDSNTWLGIPQANKNLEEAARKSAKYLQRIQ